VEERFAKSSSDLFVRQYGVKDFILYVGQIGPHRKNVYQLLKALEQVNHSAVIIGSLMTRHQAAIVSNGQNTIHGCSLSTSFRNDSMLLASAYSACDVFVLRHSTKHQAFSALEAALCRCKDRHYTIWGTRDYFENPLPSFVDPSLR